MGNRGATSANGRMNVVIDVGTSLEVRRDVEDLADVDLAKNIIVEEKMVIVIEDDEVVDVYYS